jgi:hypothetical protein
MFCPTVLCRRHTATFVWTLATIVNVMIVNVTAGQVASAQPAEVPPSEADYYEIVKLPIPDGVVLEAGASALLKSGKLAVSSRRGDIYTITNPLGSPSEMQFTKFASGLHEILGLGERDGWIYATQRGEVSRLKDLDGDGRADEFDNFADGWEIDGDYHEYNFGSPFDKNGDMWLVLCLTGSFNSNSQYRGWCLRVTPEGKVVPTCSGIRSPGGIGLNAAGDMFYTDNQGPWNGTCSLKHLRPGSFQGHPGGNRWYDQTDAIGPRPAEPQSESRMMVEAKKIPELEPPAVYFPYKKMGQSASGVACDTTGRFGPFQGQLFVGDQTFSTVMRVSLEKVKGHYQGACFPFREGFGSGTLSLTFATNGSLFVGGTNRGWGSRGPLPFALERLDWTGKVPFEILDMKSLSNGFALTFTKPVDDATARDLASYKLQTYAYIYQSSYGSPEVDHTTPTISKVTVSDDRLSVQLTVDGLQEGHIHELHLDGLRNRDGHPLLHAQAYYTLNYIP